MPLPINPGSRFLVGLNEAMFHEEYDHDLGHNQFSILRIFKQSIPDPLFPDDDPPRPYISDNAGELENFLQNTQTPQRSMLVLRVWAFERFEALKFDQNGFVVGIDDEFLVNLEKVFQAAHDHGMSVYLCINSWSIHDSPSKVGIDQERRSDYLALQETWKRILRVMLKSSPAREGFIANALIPLIQSVGRHPALFAIDLMNEPENIVDNERDDGSADEQDKVSMNDMRDYIRGCSNAIRSHDSSVKISCGFMRYTTARDEARILGPYLDFFDFHRYDNDGNLPRYKSSDFANKPCIIGECGGHIRGHELHDQGREVSAIQRFLSNAQQYGYAGCLMWMLKDYENKNEMLQALKDFADTRPLITTESRTGQRCFIATAAMGSELHPHVQFLREFRDSVILKSPYKNAFEELLDFYYRFSPEIAHSMEKNMLLKLLIKYNFVYPFVFSLKMLVKILTLLHL